MEEMEKIAGIGSVIKPIVNKIKTIPSRLNKGREKFLSVLEKHQTKTNAKINSLLKRSDYD